VHRGRYRSALLSMPTAAQLGGQHLVFQPSASCDYGALFGSDPRHVADGALLLSEAQRTNARTIESVLADAGISDTTIAAAVVNAYAESGLNASAVGDSGNSIGLFQLNMPKGAGRGHSAQELKDPRKNAEIILSVERSAISKIEDAVRAGAGLAAATALWTKLVERPKNVVSDMAKRQALALRLYPLGVPLAGGGYSDTVPRVGALIVVSLVVSFGLAGAWRYRRSHGVQVIHLGGT